MRAIKNGADTGLGRDPAEADAPLIGTVQWAGKATTVPSDTFSLITSLIPTGTRALVSRQEDESPDSDGSASAMVTRNVRNVAVLAVVPEWVFQAVVGHVKGTIERAARELDRLDIRVRLDIRRSPQAVHDTDSSETIDHLERRILDLAAEVQRLRQA